MQPHMRRRHAKGAAAGAAALMAARLACPLGLSALHGDWEPRSWPLQRLLRHRVAAAPQALAPPPTAPGP